ncbi:hypothetical protein [Singulisphaera acidiphila]|uniref:Uncharacterized protein n=1 Tax=Singulisphaera acidiphila (strain ATCC BAA-1392 / DSM 18658 / VKM B-2454 / MOB10) TaxID=886293 RepID=L0DMG8_SINAD|nr:hypothetical protein [Singulisphaera acidiphila]AGA30579.1 hypothetical protein Sinac_6503 [Singulisphaera acidiphila DSM 18658]
MASNALILRFVPLISAVAVVGWCVWPYLDSPTILEPAQSEAPESESRLFNLSLKPASDRNPFVSLDGSGAEPVERPQSGGKPRSVTVQQPSKGAAQGGNASAANDANTEESQHKWNLGATLVHGRRRAAVINGRVYLLGEMVAAASPESQPARLNRVERDLVYLQIKDRPRPIVLAYANVASPQVPSRPAPQPATTDAAAANLEAGTDLSRLLWGGKAASIIDVIRKLGLGGLTQ